MRDFLPLEKFQMAVDKDAVIGCDSSKSREVSTMSGGPRFVAAAYGT